MRNRSSKTGRGRTDTNEIAFRVLLEATGEAEKTPAPEEAEKVKDPAAVALGRKGGLKGGKARAAGMTAKQRSAAAKKAAAARWGKFPV